MAWKIRYNRKKRAEKESGAGRTPAHSGIQQPSRCDAYPAFSRHLDKEGTFRGAESTLRSRSQRDRRSWQPMPPLPFKDYNGMVVTHDRRRVPERRLDNIVVEWFL